VRIPKIDDGSEFHIVKFNFSVTVAPTVPFTGEQNCGPRGRCNQRPAAAVATEVDPLRVAGRDVVPNIGEGGVDINDLRRQGIKVDDDNEPAPENAKPTAMNLGNGWFEKPTVCPRRMATNINNAKGKFNLHRWEVIPEMNEFDLFRMCFPEQFIIDVIIPQMNQNLGTPTNLQEFYVWLGCIFYLVCFQGIGDRNKWWSSAPIHQFKGVPFWLNAYMSKARFINIMGAIRYTDKADPLLFVDRFHEVRQMIKAFNKH
jgi:hypothetical protein